MSSTLAVVTPLAALVRKARRGQAVVMTGLSWEEYQATLQELDAFHVRSTFDCGRLEIMPTSQLHEIVKWVLARLLEAWADAQGIPFSVGGEMSFIRQDLNRGLKPDECYWITNASQVRGKTALEFAVDPPPDLVLEVEISRTILDRLAVLAAFGVHEVWRCDGKNLRIGLLHADNEYLWGETSVNLPGLPVAEVVRCLQRIDAESHSTIVRDFRAWLARRQGGQTT